MAADDAGRRPAVFLDRDGTIIADVGYPRDPATVAVLEGALPALRALGESGFALVVASNQSGIGRGLITPAQAAAVHARFVAVCAEGGVRFDAVMYCPHGPDEGCVCRKPAPGMLVEAAGRLGLDLTRSFMVGDKTSDLEAGHRAGCRSIRLGLAASAGEAEQGGELVASNWSTVCELIRAAAL